MEDVEQELIETTDQPEQAEEITVEQPPQGSGETVQLPTVVILVERDEGNIEVDVVAQGDVRATEIETILKMGLNKWRGKINLPG